MHNHELQDVEVGWQMTQDRTGTIPNDTNYEAKIRYGFSSASCQFGYFKICATSRDVSFQAIAWIQAFMKLKFPNFYLFLARFGGF